MWCVRSVLCFRHMVPGNQTHVARLGGKHLDPPTMSPAPGGHTLKEDWLSLSLSQQLTVTNSSSARGGPHSQPSSPRWRLTWLELAHGFRRLSQPPSVRSYLQLVFTSYIVNLCENLLLGNSKVWNNIGRHCNLMPSSAFNLLLYTFLLQVGGVAQRQGDCPSKYGVLGTIMAVVKEKY